MLIHFTVEGSFHQSTKPHGEGGFYEKDQKETPCRQDDIISVAGKIGIARFCKMT